MNATAWKEKSIGEIVAEDFRSASLFKEAGIDFCCGGKKSLNEACAEVQVDVLPFIARLEAFTLTEPGHSVNFKEWDLDFLADYIVQNHHKFVLKQLPDLLVYTQKIAEVHGQNHPELLEVADLFCDIDKELRQHLRNEEEVLFPAVKQLLKGFDANAAAVVVSEINRMDGEHEFAGGAMDQINRITHGYTLPDDACNTYRVCFKLLEAFEDDLHVHVHLENNILFPKSVQLANSH
ncbi:MAG: iron-sulfur cluster repair di-iron protein [Bacteroidales bacterium]